MGRRDCPGVDWHRSRLSSGSTDEARPLGRFSFVLLTSAVSRLILSSPVAEAAQSRRDQSVSEHAPAVRRAATRVFASEQGERQI